MSDTLPPLHIGDRVTVVEVLPSWDDRYRLTGRPGTVEVIDAKRPYWPYQVRHDDGERWAYCRRSLRHIDTESIPQ